MHRNCYSNTRYQILEHSVRKSVMDPPCPHLPIPPPRGDQPLYSPGQYRLKHVYALRARICFLKTCSKFHLGLFLYDNIASTICPVSLHTFHGVDGIALAFCGLLAVGFVFNWTREAARYLEVYLRCAEIMRRAGEVHNDVDEAWWELGVAQICSPYPMSTHGHISYTYKARTACPVLQP